MQLDEFVQRSIEQIITGVGKAREFADANSASIFEKTERVDFDIAVTTTEGSEAKAGAGITVAGFRLGADGKSDSTHSTVSRIRFAVSVSLPGKKIQTVSVSKIQREKQMG